MRCHTLYISGYAYRDEFLQKQMKALYDRYICHYRIWYFTKQLIAAAAATGITASSGFHAITNTSSLPRKEGHLENVTIIVTQLVVR